MNPHESNERIEAAAWQDLPRERLPQRDLWSGIESRIAPTASRRRPVWPMALAASVCVTVLLGALLRMPSPSTPAPEVVGPVAANTEETVIASSTNAYTNRPYSNRASDVPSGISARALRTLRSESLDNAPAMVAQRADASGLMKASYPRGLKAHSQEAILRANLQLVSQAEREVRRALAQDPESETLQDLLAAAAEKRALLTAMLVHEQD